MCFSIRIHFIKGYTIISSFILTIIGATFISLIIVFFNNEDVQDQNWIEDGFSLKAQSNIKIIGILIGSLHIVAGAVGLVGVFQTNRRLIFGFNIASLFFFISCIAFGIINLQVYKNLKNQDCNSSSILVNEKLIVNWAQNNLCAYEGCTCNFNQTNLPLFPPKTQARFKQFGQNPLGAVKIQSCPGFQQFLTDNKIDPFIINNLQNLEMVLRCSGVCKYSLDYYFFTNINNGPPTYPDGCYILLNDISQEFVTKLAFISLSSSLLSLLNIIFIIYWYHQLRSLRSTNLDRRNSIYRSMSLFNLDKMLKK